MDDFKKRLLDAELTEDDVRAILDWQLSLPAEQMDCDLMRECDLFLSPDAPGMDEDRRRTMHDALLARIGAQPPRSAKPARLPHRRRRLLTAALIALLLLALAVGGVAYSVRRGVLNFNEDYGWYGPLVHLDGAGDFVVSGPLAHVELPHVTIDVTEAVTDGADLRVVYSVTNNEGLPVTGEPGSDYTDVPGAVEDGVHMCDWIEVNGQDAFFDDAFQAPGDAPGQMLYYLQTNLPSWGVDISGCETLDIGLPMLPRAEGERSWQTVDFTIPAKLDPSQILGAQLESADMGGHAVRVTQATFSPLSGYVEIEVEGMTRELFMREFTTLCEVYGPDDYALSGAHLTGGGETETGYAFGFTMRPPQDGWPGTLVLALERKDYTADWEAVIRLVPGETDK